MQILIIGATGYLGGGIAARLAHGGHEVTALVRAETKKDQLAGLGIKAASGQLADPASLREACTTADAIINAADSDHEVGVAAILDAIAGTGKAFIQTSGISVTADRAAGVASDVVRDEYTDFTPLPERSHRHELDQRVRNASGCRAMVICCPLVYGAPQWPDRESVQLPNLVADAKREGIARYIGDGAARWSHAHISDVAEAYALALERGIAGALYYPENGETSWLEIAEHIAAELGSPRRSISLSEAEVAWGARALWTYGSNARTRGVRLRKELGWQPKIDGLRDDIKRLVATSCDE